MGKLDAYKAPEFIATSTMSTEGTFRRYDPPSPLYNIIRRDNIQYLYIDVLSMLCVKGTLESCLVKAHDEPWAYDRHHKSMAFSELIGDRMIAKYGKRLYEFGFPHRKTQEFKTLKATELVLNEATDKLIADIKIRSKKQTS